LDPPPVHSLAADELLGNSIEHGARADATATINFTLLRTSRLIVFHIGDPGSGFSFDTMAHAAISNPPKEPLRHARYRAEAGMRPGGFGIMLVKQIADELLYSETGNEVVLIKYLENGAGHH
jgi:anti-sigma regulatory factor (Ser/Thr protein kinase)